MFYLNKKEILLMICLFRLYEWNAVKNKYLPSNVVLSLDALKRFKYLDNTIYLCCYNYTSNDYLVM